MNGSYESFCSTQFITFRSDWDPGDVWILRFFFKVLRLLLIRGISHLTIGYIFGKCITRQICCLNSIECIVTNPDGVGQSVDMAS